MGGTSQSGNRAHDLAVSLAENIRSAAITAGTTQAAARLAEITYYRSVIKSAVANNINPGQFYLALQELGATMTSP